MRFRYYPVSDRDVAMETHQRVANALVEAVDELGIEWPAAVRYFKEAPADDDERIARVSAELGRTLTFVDFGGFERALSIRGEADQKSREICIRVEDEDLGAVALAEAVAHECKHLAETGSHSLKELRDEWHAEAFAFGEEIARRVALSGQTKTLDRSARGRAGLMGYLGGR